jgi:hypothetical protein
MRGNKSQAIRCLRRNLTVHAKFYHLQLSIPAQNFELCLNTLHLVGPFPFWEQELKDGACLLWYDVSFSIFSHLLIGKLKWSSQGGTVNLIDLNPKQLEGSRAYIENLLVNEKAGEQEHKRGKVELFEIADLEAALKNSWLIIEVHGRLRFQVAMLID